MLVVITVLTGGFMPPKGGIQLFVTVIFRFCSIQKVMNGNLNLLKDDESHTAFSYVFGRIYSDYQMHRLAGLVLLSLFLRGNTNMQHPICPLIPPI